MNKEKQAKLREAVDLYVAMHVKHLRQRALVLTLLAHPDATPEQMLHTAHEYRKSTLGARAIYKSLHKLIIGMPYSPGQRVLLSMLEGRRL